MKNLNRILLAAATAASLTLASSALADDGIVASPKVRQALNDRSLHPTAAYASTAIAGACCENKIVASPKVVQTQPLEPKCCAFPGPSLATHRPGRSSNLDKAVDPVFELAEPVPRASVVGGKLPGAAPVYRFAGGLLAGACGANAHAGTTRFALCPDDGPLPD